MIGHCTMRCLGIFLGVLVLTGVGWAAGAEPVLSVTEIRTGQKEFLEPSRLAQARELFRKNNLDLADLKIFRFETDSIGYSHARCYQLYKGVLVDGGDVIFAFDKEGVFRSLSGKRWKGPEVAVEPKISMYDAAKTLFDSNRKNALGQTAFKSAAYFAERVIYEGKLAWRISLEETAPSYAIIDAANAEILSCDDGIRFQGGGNGEDPGEME